ncbi:dihydrofolate reductase [Curtobacterium sp. Leaf261]|uniref:dihydrofolate reductase n=1 Tax=Curtobacterium sp. Leaf261 TaxID=1736311 RepID=UPI0006F7429A|nr:dihydrofolate reductase [Curtobacterium sp. Leaf261]KQO63082.1 dihydrofolate reductase [Curtobacterium sp. Leaf261]
MQQQQIGLVWARSRNGVIGADGGIPWHVPEDMAHFKATTLGATVVMGRRTWESIPPRFRPFAGRRNIVLTRDTAWTADGAEVVHDLGVALRVPSDTGTLWVVGGGAVYADAVPLADRVSETVVDADVDGDTRAPELGPDWRCADDSGWLLSTKGLRYRITDLRRA